VGVERHHLGINMFKSVNDVFAKDLLKDKVAFVCGGTRGMNLAIAKAYAQAGAKVTVMSRDEERTANAAEEIKALGAEALGLAGDARDYDRVAEITKETAETFGGLDIVVAGQAGNFYAPAAGLSSNGFKAVIDIDLVGSFNVFKASYEHLSKPGASLIAITAPEAVKPLYFQTHVCSAKAGLNMLVKVLAIEWGIFGIRVNAISPGPIERSWGMENVVGNSPETIEQIRQAVPLKRWGINDDIAKTAMFLATDASSYITGTIIETDGGVTIAPPPTS